jgi:hypothetical protein
VFSSGFVFVFEVRFAVRVNRAVATIRPPMREAAAGTPNRTANRTQKSNVELNTN